MHLVRQGLQLVFIASTSADLKNARALTAGLCATLFRPTDSARTDRTQTKTSFPLSKYNAARSPSQRLIDGLHAALAGPTPPTLEDLQRTAPDLYQKALAAAAERLARRE